MKDERGQYRFQCRMNDEPAAMERLCQVVRVRGFELARMTMDRHDTTVIIEFTVEGQRCPDQLQRQLDKLHTVQSVRQLTGELRQTA